MNLSEVERSDQFPQYYVKNNLHSIDEKIDNLTKEMKIIATRSDEEESKEDELAGLEELVLLGYWRAS